MLGIQSGTFYVPRRCSPTELQIMCWEEFFHVLLRVGWGYGLIQYSLLSSDPGSGLPRMVLHRKAMTTHLCLITCLENSVYGVDVN